MIGVTGYGGIELLRWLADHPYVEVTFIGSSSQAGTDIADVYPHLQGQLAHVKNSVLQEIDSIVIAEQADLVFLSLPSGVSSNLVPDLLAKGLKVIDLAGDFRISDSETHEQWYKKTAPDRKWQQQAVYGMTELRRAEVAKAQFIANPGCYPTAVTLGLAPLLNDKLVETKSIIIDAKSGTSGAGRSANIGTSFSEVQESIHAYKIGEHQHTPEIEQFLSEVAGTQVVVSFTPHLIPMTRGILCTMYMQLSELGKQKITDTNGLVARYQDFYRAEQFVRVHKEGNYPKTKFVYGTNYCDVGVCYEARTGRIIVVSAIDNMVKGAAGQAIQNMNVMYNLSENTGLTRMALVP